jgi:predicted DNA-binding transcriptional regulator AlpA
MLATVETRNLARSLAEPSPLALGLFEYRRLTELLNVTRPTLDKWANDPAEKFPKRIKFGALYYVRFADLQKWVNQRYGGE